MLLHPRSGLPPGDQPFPGGLPEFPPEWAAQEYADDDVNHLADVARTPSGSSTLHDATDGNPTSSPRWHANMAYGGDQELIAALRTRGGEVWGALGLYREPDRPMFDAAELAFIRSISDLVPKIFFAHYEPRLRDNEKPAATDRPLRGGPHPKRTVS